VGAARARDRRLLLVGIAVVAVVGVVMRVWLLHSDAGVLDSDEGIPGLMARHFLRGEFSTFYWGQQYGGSIEVFVDALALFIGGSTRLALKTPPLLEAVAVSVLVWRLGRRTLGEHAGVLAALMVWIWPANYVWYSTKERVFYLPIVLFGLTLLLLATRLDAQPRRWRDWVGFGLVAGVGWWTGPQIVFTAAPALGWLAWRHRTRLWPGIGYAAGAAVVGAAPWIRANVHSRLASLDTSALDDHQGFLHHVKTIVSRGIPSALGLRFTVTEHWLLPPVGQALYWIGLLALAVAALRLRRSGSLLILAAAAFPFLAALSPSGGYVGEGRYLIFVWPLLALMLAGLLSTWSRRRVASIALLVLVGAISFAGLRRVPDVVSPYAPDVLVPVRMAPLVRGLERLRVRHVFAQYWVAYRLGFESEERVHATPVYSVRDTHWLAEARRDPHTGYVFVAGSATEPRFRAGLGRLGIPYTRRRLGDFVLILPARRTSPEAVSGAVSSPTLIP
jgi:hypothetical protein